MFKLTPVIDGETSLFYYQPNFLEKDEYNVLKNWLDSKTFMDGNVLVENRFRQQLWSEKTYIIFAKNGDMNMIDGKHMNMKKF